MNKFSKVLTITLLATTIVSCSPKANPRFSIGKPYTAEGVEYTPKIIPDYKEQGLSSWYGDGFHKKLTANGEIFDKNRLTAAHKTLPLPSIVTVTNLENGKSLKLRVNDRGPFVKGRIIDVSEKASKELGFFGQGSAKVLVELDKEASIKALDSIPISPEVRKLITSRYSSQSLKETKDVLTPNTGDSQESQSNQAETSSSPQNQTQPQSPQAQQVQNTKKCEPSPENQGENWVKADGGISGQPKSMQIARALANKGIKVTGISENDTTSNNKFVQIAAVSSQAEAEKIIAKLSDVKISKIEEAIVNGKKYFRVKIGGYSSESEVQSALTSLKARGYKDAFLAK